MFEPSTRVLPTKFNPFQEYLYRKVTYEAQGVPLYDYQVFQFRKHCEMTHILSNSGTHVGYFDSGNFNFRWSAPNVYSDALAASH